MTFYRRNLPHWHPEGKAAFITWRLFGSLPDSLLKKNRTARNGRATKAQNSQHSAGERFRQIDAALDSAKSGPLWLADPAIAASVEQPILRGWELDRYDLHAYVIMPNHVHILLEPRFSLARITNVLKGVSARDANLKLGRSGQPFWQDESFDHWIRNSAEFERVRHYIEWNPVSAGLINRPGDWRWSSAAKGLHKRPAG